MKRRAIEKSGFGAVLLLAAIAAMAACGDDPPPPDDPTDGGLPEGAILGPDGEILFPDGAPPTGSDAAVDASVDGDAEGGVVKPPFVFKNADYNHILSNGQSNAVASGARPSTTLPHNTVTITGTQPFTNWMFDTGVMTSVPCNGAGCPTTSYVAPTSLVPLVEGDTFFGGAYVVETASSAMANLASQLGTTSAGLAKHDVLVSLHGRSGNKYVCLRKTAQTDPDRTPPNPVPGECAAQYLNSFTEGMRQVQAGHDLAVAAGKTHAVRAVTMIHGESDHNGQLGDFPLRGSDGTPGKIKNYTDALIEWQQDYEAGAKAITKQTEGVPMFVMGISGWTGPASYVGLTEPPRYSPLAAQQYNAHVQAPGKVILVGPGYFIDQGTKGGANTGPECLHQSIVGQRQMGEYFAKVYAKVVLKGETWEPVRPKQLTRAGNVLTVEYHVPVPPLVLDTTLVTAPTGVAPYQTEENFGFEYRVGGHNGTRIGITSVVLSGPTTVTITLATTPVGANQRLIYAQNQRTFGQGCTGPGIQSNGETNAGGARGNLRDSDATPSRYGYMLYNWGVIFDVPVP